MPTGTVHQRLVDWLDASGRPWQRLDHARVESAKAAAEIRGTPGHIGGKTLVFKARNQFVLVVVPGSARLDNRAFRHALGVQRYRFARPEELAATVGLEPGCIPPFGEPLYPLPLWVDAGLAAGDRIAFTLADHTVSAVMAMSDYLELAKPTGIAPLVSAVRP